MSQEPDRPGRLRSWRLAAQLSTVGLTLAISIGLGIGLGLLLDRWLHTHWIVIAGTLLGVAAGCQQLIKAVIQANAEQEREDREEAARRRNAGRQE